MYLNVLTIFIAAVVVHAAVLPTIGDACVATTVSGHSVGIQSLSEQFHTSFVTQLKATIFKRQDHIDTNQSSLVDNPVMVIIIITIGLELCIVALALWFSLYLCIRQCLKRRAQKPNPERQRAEQVLYSHPLQPGNIELVVISNRPQTEWPLPGLHMEMAASEPDASHNSGSVNVPTRPDTPRPYFTHSHSGKTSNSEAGDQKENTKCYDSAETAIPEIYVTDTETAHAREAVTLNSIIECSHARPAAYHGAHSESTSGESTIHNTDTADIHAANGIIVRDWAY